MPELKNRRHEWFARLRAKGYRLEEAYERAGYAPDRSHSCRLASRPDVAQRINEFRVYYADTATAHRPQMIAALLELAAKSGAMGTPAMVKEARIAYLAAAMLQVQLDRDFDRDRQIIERKLGALPAKERHRGLPAAIEAAGDPGPAPDWEVELAAEIDLSPENLAREGSTAGIAARALIEHEALMAQGRDLASVQDPRA
jgi:hypothetical protein